MNNYGNLIEEFNTKPRHVFLKRLMSDLTLIPAFLLGSFTYLTIRDMINGVEGARENSQYIIAGIMFVLALIVIYSLFLRKTYMVQVFEQGVVITNKIGGKTQSYHFDEIEQIREVKWTDTLLYFIPIYKDYELEIYLQDSGKRISIMSKNMMDIKRFCATFSNVYYAHIGENEQQEP